jgi:hypothetical protein
LSKDFGDLPTMEMLRERMSFVAAATGLSTNIPNECVELMDLALNVSQILV